MMRTIRRRFLRRMAAVSWGLLRRRCMAFQPEQIAVMPNLRVISCFGVGVDKIALPAARERGIPVGHTPDILNDCVAESGVCLAA